MNLGLFRKNFDGLISKNRLFGLVIILQCIIILTQWWALVTMSSRTVIRPPFLHNTSWVGWNSASKNYYESWGDYVAELVGNLTPGSAPYVAKDLAKLFGPNSYQIVKNKVLASAAEEKADGANFSFSIKETIWQKSNKTVFVEGKLRQINSSGTMVENLPYTFQMRVHMIAGKPVLSSFTPYPGPAHTIAWEMQHMPRKTGAAQ